MLLLSCAALVGTTTATRFPSPTPAIHTSAPSATSLRSASAASVCDGRDPHEHVYHPARLVVIERCMTVTGTVMSTGHVPDGDWHIRLRLDAGQGSLLDSRNISAQHGYLIVEIICTPPILEAPAASACAGYTNTIPVPTLDTHVSVSGPYVLDATHGWNEIHPVWSLTVIPSSSTATRMP